MPGRYRTLMLISHSPGLPHGSVAYCSTRVKSRSAPPRLHVAALRLEARL